MRLGLHENSSIGFLAFIPIFAHREAQRVHWYLRSVSSIYVFATNLTGGGRWGEGRNVNVTVNKACQCGSRQSIHLRLYTCSNALRHGQGFGYSLIGFYNTAWEMHHFLTHAACIYSLSFLEDHLLPSIAIMRGNAVPVCWVLGQLLHLFPAR